MRKLSTDFTYVFKYLAPAIWFIVFGWVTFQLFVHPDALVFNGVRGSAPPSAKWLSLLMGVAGGAAFVGHGRSLKRVRLDGNTLLISNYFVEHRVPLSAVVDVYQGGWFDRTVTIELSDSTPFDREIRFIPAGRSRLAVWKEDAIVTELRRLASLDPPVAPERAT